MYYVAQMENSGGIVQNFVDIFTALCPIHLIFADFRISTGNIWLHSMTSRGEHAYIRLKVNCVQGEAAFSVCTGSDSDILGNIFAAQLSEIFY